MATVHDDKVQAAAAEGLGEPLQAVPRAPGRWRLVHWTLDGVRAVGDSMGETTITTGHGFRFRCDLGGWIGQYVFVTGAYEEATAYLMTRLVRRGDTVLDVGANVGFFTLLFSQLVGPSGRVHAFEPMPHARERLAAHLRLNGCQNVTFHETAVGAEAGTVVLYLGPRHHTSVSSLTPQESGQRVDVPCTTLNREMDGANPTLIKIDVEGWESQVVRGADHLLTLDPAPKIVAEVNDAELPGLLASHGFEIFSIQDDGLQRVQGVQAAPDQFNALFSRPPHSAAVESLRP